ncbi:MAG: hypothetical protein ABWY52_06170 [Candidatus Limnocylindrales bacterium]
MTQEDDQVEPPDPVEPVTPGLPPTWSSAPEAPTRVLPRLPIEATLRTAMDDVGVGFWRLLLIGAIGLVPIWAAAITLGDSALSSVIQFLAIIPSAALLAAAGAIRADRQPSVGGSYRQAAARLLHYFLANLLVGVVIVLIVIVPVILIAVAIGFLIVSGASETAVTVAIVLVTALVALVAVTYASARLALIGPIIVVEGLGVGEAITLGWRRTRGQVLRLLIVFIAGSVPGVLVGIGGALLAFGLLSQPILIGVAFGLAYTVAVAVLSCVNVAAWERLDGSTASVREALDGSVSETTAATPAVALVRRADRGPATAILLLIIGLAMIIGGSLASVGKIGGWIGSLSGQAASGTVTFGVGGFGCFQVDERGAFEAGETIHAVANLGTSLPAGERVQYEVYADSELIDRGFEEPFAEATSCVFFDLDTTETEPATYTVRYLWGADIMAEGSFTIRP